jgi:LEA14-like dessication related protein
MAHAHASRRHFTLLAALLALLSGCGLLMRQPELTLEQVKMSGLSLSGTTLTAYLQVGNPNFYDVTTQKVTYQLTVEGKPAGEGVLEKSFVVPAGQRIPLEFPVNVSWSAAMGGFRSAMEKGKVDAVTTGIITVKTLMGPVDFPYEVRTFIGELPDGGAPTR